MDLEKVIFPKKNKKHGLKMPLLSWKNHVTAKIVCVAANILYVAAIIARVAAIIARVVADMTVEEAKVAGPRKFFTFLKIFLSFLGFSVVKIDFFQKVLKNGLVSEKNYFIFFLF